MRAALVVAALCSSAWGQTASSKSGVKPDVQKAIKRAIPLIQTSAAKFVEQRACFSCHSNALPIMSLRMALERGFKIDDAALSAVEAKTFKDLTAPNAADIAIQATTLSDPTPNDSLLLMSAEAAERPRDLALEVQAARMMNWQRDGHWVTSDFRPPHSTSNFTATATAIRAVVAYAPDELKSEKEAVLGRAREWLVAAKPVSTEDATFRLLGLVWASGERAAIENARRDLLAMQRPNGAWAQTTEYEPDAYSTGEALYALQLSGAAALAKAVKFLTSTQAADGSWHVHTRMLSPADVSPPYFTSGFPYGHDEYISFAATNWAAMALLQSVPRPAACVIAPPEKPQPSPAWLRTALWGTPEQVASLDASLKTERGTTVLMAAAGGTSAGPKVRDLLKRGADPQGALSIAASYRGTSDAVAALLDAGADPNPKRRVPLMLASKTGDIANVKVLLAHGADPAAGIGEAITFDYPEILKLLLDSGAPATLKQGDGVNLLHWATITNRADVIPILAKAGAKINELDDQGYTPLMYAATIDFDTTDTLRALLAAGAKRDVKNDDGRTPLEQARHFRHRRIERILQ